MDKSVETKRQMIMTAYPSPKWVSRCKTMDDKQVIAIYFRLLREGKIGAAQ